MRIFLLVLMLVVFSYALALVLQNPVEVQVDVLFATIPTMRVGLLILLILGLGLLLGLLLGVQVFKVIQTRFEIKHLRQDIEHLRKEQIQSAQHAAAQAALAVQQSKHVSNVDVSTK